MAVPADDGVCLREHLCQLHIIFKSQVAKYDEHITEGAEVLVVCGRFKGRRKLQPLALVGVRIGNPCLTDLYQPQHTDAYAVALENFVGLHVDALSISGKYIGADKIKLGRVHIVAESGGAGVELMVTEGGKVESHMVHQSNHGDTGAVAVVHVRIACAAVARSQEEQARVIQPLLLHAGSQPGHAVDVGVHIIDAQNGDLLAEGGAQKGKERK